MDGALADEREELGDAVVTVARGEVGDAGALGGVVGPVTVPGDVVVEVPEDGGHVALAEGPVDAGDGVDAHACTVGHDGRVTIDYRDAVDALDRAYGGISAVTERVSRHDLLAFTLCHGWVVADVLFHLLCDAQRALVALATPAPGPPDRDYVTYWSGFQAEAGDPTPAAWWVRRSASAFRDGTGAVTLWLETAPAAVRAARRADPDGCIATQGHVLAVRDFLATLVTEAVIHHLDLTANLPGRPAPDPVAVALASRTLDGLLGSASIWTGEEYLLKATGRIALTSSDRDALGPLVRRFPLLS